ncbi:MAG: type III pantothenate kinase [Bacteroidales bacterium]|nr:type III pantothenate kinase [Bacteroidales bacterium]
MKFLLLDVGNSLTKWALATKYEKIDVNTFPSSEKEFVEFLSDNKILKADLKVYSSVKKLSSVVRNQLNRLDFISLKSIAHSFVQLNYSWDEIGEDRISASLGAYYSSRFHTPLLIVQLGTAITYDYMLAPLKLEGGAISPGLYMRFRSLHNFTDLLPFIEPETFAHMMGHSTRDAILSGVMEGVKAELLHRIHDFFTNYPTGKVYISGGDIKYFAISDKNRIFAEPDLVLLGLYYAAMRLKQT